MSEAPRSIQKLARELRGLIAGGQEPEERELAELQRRLQNEPELEVPHVIWHWLADADVRAKDPAYRRAQMKQLETALEQMESPHAT